jgi:hypothetical protein
MYSKWVFLLFLLCLASVGRAQVSLAVQVPPTGVLQKSQLWNLVLVSTADQPVTAYVKLTLLSTKDNTPLMTAITKDFLLTKGAKQLSNNEVSPVQYNYFSAAFNADRNPNGLLPVGNYLACYTVLKSDGELSIEMAEECIPVEVEPLSPPLLNTPFDRDTVANGYPQFTWLPPTPLGLFNDLSYDMLITEVMANQSATESIQQNIPVYSAGNLRTLVNLYPASNKALDTAKWYAWRVIAKNNNQLVAQSEVWVFRVASLQPPAVDLLSKNYLLLQRQEEAGGVSQIKGDSLGIKYYSFEKQRQALVRITKADGTVIKEVNQQVGYGDNFFRYPLGNAFEKGQMYRIEITDSDRKRYTASFSIL